MHSINAFVTTKTQLPTIQLYAVKPTEAAICPMNKNRDTPSVAPLTHCLCTCLAMVNKRMIELAQPMISAPTLNR